MDECASTDAEQELPAKELTAVPRRGPHPIESRVWFRLAKISWWLAIAIGTIVLLIASETIQSFLRWPPFLSLLHLEQERLIYYIALGRPTPHEKRGSGFVNLDELELDLMAQKSGPTGYL